METFLETAPVDYLKDVGNMGKCSQQVGGNDTGASEKKVFVRMKLKNEYVGGGFKDFLVAPPQFGEIIQIDEQIVFL